MKVFEDVLSFTHIKNLSSRLNEVLEEQREEMEGKPKKNKRIRSAGDFLVQKMVLNLPRCEQIANGVFNAMNIYLKNYSYDATHTTSEEEQFLSFMKKNHASKEALDAMSNIRYHLRGKAIYDVNKKFPLTHFFWNSFGGWATCSQALNYFLLVERYPVLLFIGASYTEVIQSTSWRVVEKYIKENSDFAAKLANTRCSATFSITDASGIFHADIFKYASAVESQALTEKEIKDNNSKNFFTATLAVGINSLEGVFEFNQRNDLIKETVNKYTRLSLGVPVETNANINHVQHFKPQNAEEAQTHLSNMISSINILGRRLNASRELWAREDAYTGEITTFLSWLIQKNEYLGALTTDIYSYNNQEVQRMGFEEYEFGNRFLQMWEASSITNLPSNLLQDEASLNNKIQQEEEWRLNQPFDDSDTNENENATLAETD